MLKSGRRPVLGMILKGYPRISETFISNEILLLEQLGFRVHIFSMRQPRETFSHASVRRIEAAVDYLPERMLPKLPQLVRENLLLAAQAPVRYRQALKMACTRFLRTRRSATLKHLLQAGFLVRRLLPGSGVAHLHAHFAHSPTSVALFAGLLGGLPFSFTAHAKDIYTSHPQQLAEKIARARFVVTCTRYNRRYLQRLASTCRTPIDCVYHGIDVRRFSAGTSPGAGEARPHSPYRLLTVARLTPKKGLPTVFKALVWLRARSVPFEHVLIGDGEARAEILGHLRSLQLESAVRWLGTQPHDVVLKHYRRADLFLLGCEVAANGDRDGIPNVLLESMAMGVPVVATRVSAIPELVQDQAGGLLVAPRNPAEMGGAALRLLTDHGLRQRVIARGRQRVRQHFDNRLLIRNLAQRFRTALAETCSVP